MSPVNLPLFSNKDLGSIKSSINAGHAQNFSISQLNTRKEIDEAKVSVAQIGHNSDYVTSINRINTTLSQPTDSVSHIGEKNLQDVGVGDNQNEMDDKRYEYIRRLAINRKKEKEEEGQKSIYDIGVKTGGGFRTRSFRSIKRRLNRLYYTAPSTFKNIDKDDRKYIADKIQEHAKKVRIGVGFGRQVRRKMKREIEKDRQRGVISKADSQDMKKIVDNLQH